MPYFDSLMPSKMFYASICFEILRIASTNSELFNLVVRDNLWLIQMKKHCSECAHVTQLLKKIFEKHCEIFHKFADIADEFINLLSS